MTSAKAAAAYKAQIAKLRSEKQGLRAELKAAKTAGAPKETRQSMRNNAKAKKAEIKTTRQMRKSEKQGRQEMRAANKKTK